MQLNIRDAAELLKIPEKDLYKLTKKNEIPHYILNKSPYFNRAELLEWSIAKSRDISPDFFATPDNVDDLLPHLYEALENGGIHTLAPSTTKAEVLRNVVTLIPSLSASESELIYSALMARETLGSTAIGNGIAIPHVRNPIILNIKGPAVLLCFLSTPIDFGAIDNIKVSTVFTMISPTARVHLHLLARLSYLLQKENVQSVLSPQTDPARILDVMRTLEHEIGKGTQKNL